MAGVATTVDGLLPLVDAVRIVLGVHGAGVSVVREGFLSVAAGGSGAVSELGRAQERTQAGPSLDAAATGAPVLSPTCATRSIGGPRSPGSSPASGARP